MGRPPKIAQTAHSYDEEQGIKNSSGVDIPGYMFRWVNLPHRSKSGWGIWTPVLKNGEFGDKVKDQLGEFNDRFAGLNAEANLFHQGEESVLAYTTVERYEARKVELAKRVNDRINMIDAAQIRRNVVIPATGNYRSQFTGGD